jgi:rhamnosyltransferase
MSKFCVLMAAYNGEQYLDEQIRSILEQENVEIDLYIRLDPSIDDSENIIKGYSDEIENVHYIAAAESSGSAGQNFFNLLLDVNFESYDYVAFADQDDIWLREKLKRAEVCLTNNNFSAYSGNVIAFWGAGKEQIIVKSSPQRKYDYLFESAGPGCTFVFQVNLASELKKYLQTLEGDIKSLWLHDWFCYAFSRSRGFKWFIDDKPMMMYRQHESNSVGANSGWPALKARVLEVVSGSAFDKVINQASVLGVDSQKPILLLSDNKFISSIKLISYSSQCRRKPLDKLFFALAVIIHAFRRKK